MRILRAALAPLLVSSLLACAPGVSQQDRRAIGSVSIVVQSSFSPRVLSVPQDTPRGSGGPPVIPNSPEAALIFLAVIGVAVIIHAAMPPRQPLEPFHQALSNEFIELLRVNEIDLQQVVKEEFAAEVLRSKAFGAVVDEGEGYGVFRLKIEDSGLSAIAPMDASNAPLRPRLKVVAALHARNGPLLWQKTAAVDGLTPTLPVHRFEELRADPQLVRDTLRQAAAMVAADLLKKIDER